MIKLIDPYQTDGSSMDPKKKKQNKNKNKNKNKWSITENGFQTVVSAVSQRESIQLYLSLAKLKSRINRSADLKAEQIRLKKRVKRKK